MLPLWLILVSCVLVVALFALVLYLITELRASQREAAQALQSMQMQSTHLSQALSDKLHQNYQETVTVLGSLQSRLDHKLKETSDLVQTTHQTVGQRLDKNHEIFSLVQERLGKIEQTGQDIKNVGREIQELQNIFKAPKQRGTLGEEGLEQILAQILPKPNYDVQYSFRDNAKVDAVIRLSGDQLVPIDAKFPYENFKRMTVEGLPEEQQKQYRKAFQQDVKKHIDDIASKYIRPNERTLDFALMYIPSENVFYEAILKDERFGEIQSLQHYALQKRVIPVSPNSIYAYLQAILMGLRGLKIEERTKEIFVLLEKLKKDLGRFSEDFSLVRKHLDNAQSAYEKCEKPLDRIKGKLESIHEEDPRELPEANPS